MPPITLDIVEAYSLCPRKAFLLQRGEPLGKPHEYIRLTDEQEAANRQAYQASLAEAANTTELADRLINVACCVYGKVYFPIHSNGLKVLGRFVGATWSNSEASGLMSLVWRHLWETTGDSQHKAALLGYNREDCEAVRLLLVRLTHIQETADSEPTVDFARRPKQTTTESGRAMHQQFERILHNAQEDGQRRSVRVRGGTSTSKASRRKRGPRKGTKPFNESLHQRSVEPSD